MTTSDVSIRGEARFSAPQYAICLAGIIWREGLRFLHQRERFISALVRPLGGYLERVFSMRGRISPGARRVDHPAL